MGSASVLLVLGVILAQGQTSVQNGDTGPATGARLFALPRPDPDSGSTRLKSVHTSSPTVHTRLSL